MKLLHVISSLEIGGAQRLLSDLLPIQKQDGLDVTVLVNIRINNDFTRKIEEAGIKILSLEESNIHSIKNIFLLRKVIKDFDIIHVHLFPSIYWVALASIGLDVKLVYTEHSTSNRRREKGFFRPIEKFMYGKYSKIISISKQTQIALQKWLESSDNRFIVINNGVNTKLFSEENRPVIPKSLIMISRFATSKDHETVIRAMKEINDDEVVLRFVGDGETLEHCKQVAKNEGVSEKVNFLGARSDVMQLVAESYLGIQSSNWEGFGLTAVELMAAGKPVIASNVDGLKQVVEGAGEIFHKGDAKDLAKKISRLLNDKAYYIDISKKCKQRALNYDISVMANSYMTVYNVLRNDN